MDHDGTRIGTIGPPDIRWSKAPDAFYSLSSSSTPSVTRKSADGKNSNISSAYLLPKSNTKGSFAMLIFHKYKGRKDFEMPVELYLSFKISISDDQGGNTLEVAFEILCPALPHSQAL